MSPEVPKIDPWPAIEKLSKEKEVIGIYISGIIQIFKFKYKDLNLNFEKDIYSSLILTILTL